MLAIPRLPTVIATVCPGRTFPSGPPRSESGQLSLRLGSHVSDALGVEFLATRVPFWEKPSNLLRMPANRPLLGVYVSVQSKCWPRPVKAFAVADCSDAFTRSRVRGRLAKTSAAELDRIGRSQADSDQQPEKPMAKIKPPAAGQFYHGVYPGGE